MESTATGALTKAHAKATEAFFKIPLMSAKEEKNHTISENVIKPAAKTTT
jgi:hypothetical protein